MCGLIEKQPAPIDKPAPAPTREVIDMLDDQTLSRHFTVRASGIRIGCTFVTEEAAEFIFRKWKEARGISVVLIVILFSLPARPQDLTLMPTKYAVYDKLGEMIMSCEVNSDARATPSCELAPGKTLGDVMQWVNERQANEFDYDQKREVLWQEYRRVCTSAMENARRSFRDITRTLKGVK